MAFLKTWSLLPLAALLLLSIVPTVAKVVTSMSDCEGFLLNETPPNIPGILEKGNIQDQNRYKPICQTFEDTRRFVTLYDTENKIPVFSAYRYRGTSSGRPNQDWKIEPQLEDPSYEENMVKDNVRYNYDHQARETDYQIDKQYDRGHLFPSSYAFSRTDKKSTFTLTNTVPQLKKFNRRWSQMETRIQSVLDKYCVINGAVEAFLVTGAQPGTNTLNNILNGVNIPSLLWSAFCCYSSTKGEWLAAAYWRQNAVVRAAKLETKTLQELYNALSTSGSEFEVFPGSQCPLTTTVTELDPKPKNPKPKKTCNRPRSISVSKSGPLNPTSSQQNPMCTCRRGRCILHNINKFNTFPSDIRCHCNYPSISQQARCCRSCSQMSRRRHSDG